MRLFFAAHGPGFILIGVVESRLLHHRATTFQYIDLAFNLELDGLFNKLKRVEVLQLCAGTESFPPFGSYRYISITAKRALLHVAITDFQVSDKFMQFLEIGNRFRR